MQYHQNYVKTLKLINPKKNFPVGIIVPAIETVPNGITKCVAEITQPSLDKNVHPVINYTSFVSKAKTWQAHQDEMQQMKLKQVQN